MSSIMGDSPTRVPDLRRKVDHVKCMLKDASERLQCEASKQSIFATKTSASSMAPVATKLNGNGQKHGPNIQYNLERTINDIVTIQTVLSCPIFDRIVNVTDSLDKLSYHLNLRPSIDSSDIDINDNGELILAPPIESTTLNNYINKQLDGQYSTDHSSSQQLVNQQEFSPVDCMSSSFANDNERHHPMGAVGEVNQDENLGVESTADINNYVNTLTQQSKQQQDSSNQVYNNDEPTTTRPLRTNNQQQVAVRRKTSEFDSEKLVTNRRSSKDRTKEEQHVEHSVERTRVKSVAAAFESAINGSEGRRLYKTNGNFALNRMSPSTNSTQETNQTNASKNVDQQASEKPKAQPTIGYSNDLYHGAQELSSNIAISHQTAQATQQCIQPVDFDPHSAYANGNIRKQQQQHSTAGCERLSEPQASQQAAIDRPARASPSASAGSTVKLADECDSGTSSFRSQAARGALYSPQSHKPIEHLGEDTVDNSLDQDLIDTLSPEMERIKVTLEKGPEGIGITIAGYTCEQEEISGIFIKSITPGSPADRCGKIRILDQIFAVNGEEILGYSNPEATNVLRRHTGKVVTLELMRYLAESRYQKLQSLLENAAPAMYLKKSIAQPKHVIDDENYLNKAPVAATNILISSSSQGTSGDSSNNASGSLIQPSEMKQQVESIYKNSSNFGNHHEMTNVSANVPQQTSQSSVPVAAQRYSSTTHKVIETKQGARNTIAMRSPMCQTTATATYVNKFNVDVVDSRAPTNNASGNFGCIRQEVREEFVRGELKWERREVKIVELQRESSSHGLGFTVREYNDPENQGQSIIMIRSIASGGIADMNGQLSQGDLLVFVDDKNLERASLDEAVKALKETSGNVRLGVLKFIGKLQNDDT